MTYRPHPLPPLPVIVPSPRHYVAVVLDEDPRGDAGESCRGTWDSVTRVIAIDRKQTVADQWVTLLHECVHMVISDADIALTPKKEEQICEAISHWLLAQASDVAPLLSLPKDSQ